MSAVLIAIINIISIKGNHSSATYTFTLSCSFTTLFLPQPVVAMFTSITHKSAKTLADKLETPRFLLSSPHKTSLLTQRGECYHEITLL